LEEHEPGDEVTLRLVRDGQPLEAPITLGQEA
jgi:hypothetical protein